ncbi:MAG: STAS domain-containing protein [Planctomycetota bacterium]
MEIGEQKHGAVTVLRPEGPLVSEDALQFCSRAKATIGRCMGRVVIDGGRVSHADSAGLEAVLDLCDALESTGRALRMCGVSETLRESLELTGISDQVEFFEDVTGAVRSFL